MRFLRSRARARALSLSISITHTHTHTYNHTLTRTHAQVLVTNEVGGRWRFRLALEAKTAEPDDTIHLVSALNKTASVAFHLTNHTDEEAAFTAVLTPTTQRAFAVHPLMGVLRPYGTDGTRFVIEYQPREYGKAYSADLVVSTNDMQWIYRHVCLCERGIVERTCVCVVCLCVYTDRETERQRDRDGER